MRRAEDSGRLAISKGARQRRSELENYSIDALVDLILHLEGFLPDDTANFPRPLGLRPFELPWQPQEFVRLGDPEEDEQEGGWQIALVSFDLVHPVMGLELYGEVLVGRSYGDFSPDIDLAPYDGIDYGVSRQHALLRARNDQLELVDLGSSNGTYINGAPLRPGTPQALNHKDKIEFGGLQFEVRIVSGPA